MSVTIIGGGMTGAMLALILANLTKGKLFIDLVEARMPGDNFISGGFDDRTVVLSQGTFRDLSIVGIWPELAPYTTAIKQVEISEQGYFDKCIITASEYRLPALGYVVSLKDIGTKIFNLINQVPYIKLHCPAKLKQIIRKKNNNLIILDNDDKISNRLVVAADGSNSELATKCGIRWQKHEYQQVAIIANVKTSISNNNKAFERFSKYGSLALLPKFNENSLIWCLPDKYKQKIINLDIQDLCQILQKIFGSRVGRILNISKRFYYPLQLFIATQHITHRMALIGNAAQTLHPIAAQGLNLGLRDVITLAKILTQATVNNEDIGDYYVLNHYQQCRKTDQLCTINITNKLVKLCSSHDLPLIITRNLGLSIIAHFPLLRNVIIRKTLGLVTS